MKNKIIWGDCLLELKKLKDNSIDSIVTDPPYGLSFMGKKWDYEVPSVEIWKECLRVLKPGGHLLSFAGSRTYHRIAVNIEDAGFDIRDQIMWLYGSGFPKSYNVGKGVDKVLRTGNASWNGTADPNNKPLGYSKLQHNQGYRPNDYSGNNQKNEVKELKEEAKQWEGWGTALKPAHEPIVVARKPLSEKNVALNVLKWGTAGINIDGCRVGDEVLKEAKSSPTAGGERIQQIVSGMVTPERTGRFPANIIFDDEAGKMLDEQSGASRFFYCAKASKRERNEGCEGLEKKIDCDRNPELDSANVPMNRSNNPKRNNHPTVKPIKLMRYLVRLVTPKGGLCLDPFIGSGTTAIACKLEGFDYLGIEREADYIPIAEARIKAYQFQDKL